MEEDPDLGLVARVSLRGVSARVEGPARALAVVARDSSIRVEPGATLEYASLRLASAGARLGVRLRPGGGVVLHADASAARLELHPEAPGEYWLEIDARASAVRVASPQGAVYEVAPGVSCGAKGVSLKVARGRGEGRPLYVIRVSFRGTGAAVKLE